MPSPFPTSTSTPGHGEVRLTLLPPCTPSFSTLNSKYPLKLLPSAPHKLDTHQSATSTKLEPDVLDGTGGFQRNTEFQSPASVPLLFLLTYGGGLLAGDATSVDITLEAGTRLTAATQGMTRIYGPAPDPANSPADLLASHVSVTSQFIRVRLFAHSALWLAPDPIQPFARSVSTQTQLFHLDDPSASIGFIDWVCEGRKSRGECWAFDSWRSRNEIWMQEAHGQKQCQQQSKKRSRLLVRDTIMLDGQVGHKKGEGGSMKTSMDSKGLFGSLILYGPVFQRLARFFSDEFAASERVGSKDWGTPVTASSQPNASSSSKERRDAWRRQRQASEKANGILWTATCLANRGGVTIVKFSAVEVDDARRWLGDMLRQEGTIASEFGDGGLMFAR